MQDFVECNDIKSIFTTRAVNVVPPRAPARADKQSLGYTECLSKPFQTLGV